jgi:hypothetical protein
MLEAQDDLMHVGVGQTILQTVRPTNSSSGSHARRTSVVITKLELLSCMIKINQQVGAFRVSAY